MTADEVIAVLGLEPLPVEGGYFRQIWRSPATGDRPVGTAIVALLTDAPEGFSQFHRLDVDELWHFYLGDAVELVLLESGGLSQHVRLGHDLAAGEHITWVVAAGTWMAARTTGTWSVVGNTLAPGFTSDRYEGAAPDDLLAGWPHERASIEALTRPGSERHLPPGL